MTSFRFRSVDGTTNVELLTDLIGYSDGSENLTVCQVKVDGTDNAASKGVVNTFPRNKTSVSELKAYAVAQDLRLEVIPIGKNEAMSYGALSAPTAFVANEDSATQITLGWTKATGATGYKVTRSTAADFSANVVNTTVGDVALLVVPGLVTATHYYFRISSIATGAAESGYAYADDTTD